MGRRLEYEVKTSVRLNMSNPQHVKINDVIQNLDPKIFKSKNQFIIDAIQFYIDNYGKETFVIKKKEKERAEYIRSEDIDDIKEEVIEAATNEARYAYIRNSKDVYSFNFNVLPETQAKASFSHTFRKVEGNLSEIHIFHTDRGNEFKNETIEELLEMFHIERSLSHKGCPYDNAVAEATFKVIKTEFVWNETFHTLEELKIKLWDYVNWYNHHRIHSSLGYQTPVQYRENNLKKFV